MTQIGKNNPKIYQRILVSANLRDVSGGLPDGCIVGSGSSCCGSNEQLDIPGEDDRTNNRNKDWLRWLHVKTLRKVLGSTSFRLTGKLFRCSPRSIDSALLNLKERLFIRTLISVQSRRSFLVWKRAKAWNVLSRFKYSMSSLTPTDTPQQFLWQPSNT